MSKTKTLTDEQLKNRRGPVPELSGDPEIERVLKDVSHFAQLRWIKRYGKESSVFGIRKGIEFLKQNPSLKADQPPGNFFSHWVKEWASPYRGRSTKKQVYEGNE